jgi:hypothetical protein
MPYGPINQYESAFHSAALPSPVQITLRRRASNPVRRTVRCEPVRVQVGGMLRWLRYEFVPLRHVARRVLLPSLSWAK